MSSKKKKFKVKICGEDWTIEVVDDKLYTKKYGGDSEAITTPTSRNIAFHKSHCTDISTIIHELVHAYMFYLHLRTTTDVHIDDFEEIVAEFFSYNLIKILSTASQIYFNNHEKISKIPNSQKVLSDVLLNPNNKILENLVILINKAGQIK